jgi:branched-chain amino acid transport system ATP-binding protein
MTANGEVPLLEAQEMTVGYGGVPAVRDLSLRVYRGEIVAMLGPNGAGKTTTVMGLAGILPLSGGKVLWKGAPARSRVEGRVRDGMAIVRQERSIVASLSVRDNISLACPVEEAVKHFPELEAHLKRPSGLLSGGQQQMLELGRALGRRPALLIVDELSLGLAPLIVQRLFAALDAARTAGVGILLVEQHARRALGLADRGYVLARGQVEMEGKAGLLASRLHDIEAAYLSSGAP